VSNFHTLIFKALQIEEGGIMKGLPAMYRVHSEE